MAEQKIRPIKSRVLYVRMKLLHRPSRPQQERSCFHTYYKWLLWFSFSLYFFASYLIGSDPHPPLSSLRTTHVSTRESNRLSRALFESSHLAPQKPQTSPGCSYCYRYIEEFSSLRSKEKVLSSATKNKPSSLASHHKLRHVRFRALRNIPGKNSDGRTSDVALPELQVHKQCLKNEVFGPVP